MADGYKVQINVKIGDHLINIQGDTPQEAFGHLAALHGHKDDLNRMLSEMDSLPIAEKEWGSRSQRRKTGGSQWNRNSAPTAAGPASPGTSATSSPSFPSDPPPAFVQNQQAQPAQWDQHPPQQNPVQVAQQALGATVQQVVPNEVAYCVDHGNQPRQYYAPGYNQNTGKNFSASYRCSQRGCGAYWQNDDGSWRRSASR